MSGRTKWTVEEAPSGESTPLSTTQVDLPTNDRVETSFEAQILTAGRMNKTIVLSDCRGGITLRGKGKLSL